MRKLKFFIYTFFTFVVIVTSVVFLALPVAKTVISKITGIYFNFDNIDYNFPDNIVVERVKIQKSSENSALNISVSRISVTIGEIYHKIAVSDLSVDGLSIEFNLDKSEKNKKDDYSDKKEKKTGLNLNKPFNLPFFPVEKISVKNVFININTPTASIVSGNISLEGEKEYKITVPSAVMTPSDPSAKRVDVTMDASFMADGTRYAVLELNLVSPFITIKGIADRKTSVFSADFNILTEEIFSLLGVKSKGDVSGSVSIKSEITGVPDADVIVKSRISKINEFAPWDFDLNAKLYSTGFDINSLAVIREKKVFLTANGRGVFADNLVSGTIKMTDTDFKDIMRRVDVSNIVNMRVDGDVKFSNPLDDFKLALDADLKVRDFFVEDDGFSIVKLAEPHYVRGNLVIDSSKVSLFSANVTSKDKTTNLFLKDTWFSFGDDFYINVINGSYININKISTLLGLNPGGAGNVAVLISSRYENPLIKGNVDLSAITLGSIHIDSYKGSLLLRNFVMQVKSELLAFGHSKTHGVSALIDLNGEKTVFDLTVNNLSGDISDFGKLSASAFPVTGPYSLSAKLKMIGSNIETANLYFESSDIKDNKHLYADKLNLHLGTAQNGFFVDNSFISRKRSRFDISGTVGRDLNADIKAVMTSFFIDDFAEFGDFSALSFMAPQVNLYLKGNVKDSFSVKGDAFLGKISYETMNFGNFSASMNYIKEDNSLKIKGDLGDSIKFTLESPDISSKSIETSVNIDKFHLETETGQLDLSGKIKYGTSGIDSVISELRLSEPMSGLYIENTSPVSVTGTPDNIIINKSTLGGNVADLTIEGTVKDYVPDIILGGSLYTSGIETKYSKTVSDLKGFIGIDAYLKGDKFGAVASLNDFNIYVKPLSISFSDINGKLVVDNDGWRTENIQGILGDGVVKLNGSGLLHPEFSGILNLNLNNAIIKPKQIGQMRITSDLELNIPEDDFISLSGDVEIKNFTYRKTISLESTLIKSLLKPKKFYAKASSGEEQPVRLNVNLKANNNINLESNLVKTALDIDLNVSGNTESPNVKGYVTLNDGTIYFQNNEFEIERGIIDIDTYEEIKPYLDIESTTEVPVRPRGSLPDDDQRVNYQLFLKIFGYLDDIQVELSSNPYEEQTDVYSILLFGELFDDDGLGQMNMGSIAISAVSGIVGINEAVQNNFKLTSFELKPMTDREGKTVLKFSAMKEIYPFLRVTLISNPVETKDQKMELKYIGDVFDINFDYSSYSDYETNYGSIGFDVRLDYAFE